jgi:hypothetical protein
MLLWWEINGKFSVEVVKYASALGSEDGKLTLHC